MRRIRFMLLALGLSLLVAAPSFATRVVVPTHYPTIQQAVDSGADTVAIRDSVALERVTVSRPVVIEPEFYPGYYNAHDATPEIRSLDILPNPDHLYGYAVRVRGVRFRGEVNLTHEGGQGPFEFTGCRFDSSITASTSFNPGRATILSSSMLFGPLTLGAQVLRVVGNAFIGGEVLLRADGLHTVVNNLFLDSPGAGLRVSFDSSLGSISGNTVRGSEDGIVVEAVYSQTLAGNEIEDVRGSGIVYRDPGHPSYVARLRDNVIRRCAGDGIRIEENWNVFFVVGNVVEDAGGDGIRSEEFVYERVEGNRVLRAGSVGLRLPWSTAVRRNVIGRCGGDGIQLAGSDDANVIESNTCFANGGAGIRVSSTGNAADSVRLNLCALNTGPGLAWAALNVPVLECNDWYANSGGLVTGIPIGMFDVAVDPGFCNLPANDVSLASTSPLLSLAGCDTIGALGVGCAATVAVGEQPSSPVTRFAVWPVPARGSVRFLLPGRGAAELEVFDVTGARRWRSAVGDGTVETTWDGRDAEGARLPAGVYFARLLGRNGAAVQSRVVLVE